MSNHVRPIEWHDGELRLLDQRRLPRQIEWVSCRSAEDVADAIREMVVRGAPAIGVCAAYGVVLAARQGREKVREGGDLLRRARPTAVNLAWAIDRMLAVAAGTADDELGRVLEHEANAIFDEDVAANRAIGRFGSDLLAAEATVLTHCNAGALATAGYGTALGVIRAAVAQGKKIRVFADETRPFLQGARLTAWELQQESIDVTLITDNMSGYFFERGEIDAVVVGADRIAANGDTANKIGTYILAVLAAAHSVPFYIAAPVSTVDLGCTSGKEIPIEERSAAEVVETTGWNDRGELTRVAIAPEGIAARHPAFDVTPARYITAIITDRGVARPPFEISLRELMP